MNKSGDAAAFDLVVVGGGIYGCMMLEQARQRGLDALLLERDTLGSGVSGNNYRTLHGGLRSLQTGDFSRFFEGVRERRGFFEQYADYCSVEQFVLPLAGAGLERGWIARGAALLNNQLSARRNRGMPPRLVLPPARFLSAVETKPLVAGIDGAGNAGALSWYDGRLDDPVGLFAHLADRFNHPGSTVAVLERAPVQSITRQRAGYQLRVADPTDQGVTTRQFHARRVIDATGVWHSPWFSELGFQRRYRPTLAWNVLYEHEALSDLALGVRLETGQRIFLKNLEGRLYVGTGHAPMVDSPTDLQSLMQLVEPLVAAFTARVSQATGLSLAVDAICQTQVGVLPAVDAPTLQLAVQPALSWDSAQQAVHVTGVKFTTAPGVARRVLNQLRF